MKVSANVDTGGVAAALDRLSEEVRESLLRSMLVASGKVIRDEAKARVPVETGKLKASLYLAHSPERSGSTQQVYHVSWNKSQLTGAPHGHLVEFGHWQTHQIIKLKSGEWVTLKDRPLDSPKWVPAKPFLRPAMDAAAARAVDAAVARGRQRLPELLREVTP